jgi:hypothetical protein
VRQRPTEHDFKVLVPTMAAPDVKPEMTACDRNSVMKPRPSTAMATYTNPTSNEVWMAN